MKEGEDERVYHAIARDISDGGLLLENVDIPTEQSSIRIDFRIPGDTMPEEFVQGKYRLEGKILRYDREKRQAALSFEKELSKHLVRTSWLFLKWIAVLFLFVAVSLILLIKLQNIYFFWFDVPVFLYSLTVGSYLISRFLFASFYRTPREQTNLPTVTVVVPAYNEEEVIEQTLVHALEVSYPHEKIQVIVCYTQRTK